MNKEKTAPKTGLRRLMQLAGDRKGQLALACVLSSLAAAARLVPFFTIYELMRLILQHYGNPTAIPSDAALWLTGATAASAAAYAGFGFAAGALSHRAAYDVLYEIRMRLVEKLARLPSGYFANSTQGSLKKVVHDDVEKIEEFIAHGITDTVAAVVLPLLTLAFLLAMDWRLALCTVLPLAFGVAVLASGLRNPENARAQAAMHETRRSMSSLIVEYVHGMQVIKAYDRDRVALGRLEASIDGAFAATEHAARFFAPRMGAYFSSMGSQLLLLLPAGLVVASSARSYVDFLPLLLLFFLVGSGLKEPLENMMSLALSTKSIAFCVARIDEVLAEEEVAAPEHPAKPDGCDVVFDDVSFSYVGNGSLALDGVSFSLRSGTVTGLVGPSGAGKSTVAQLLLRFNDVRSGSIFIGGADIKEMAPSDLSDLVGCVLQTPMMFHDTVEGNVRMGNEGADRADVEAACRAACIHDVIEALPMGYDTLLGSGGSFLSGGEMQRIAIARVFLKDPPIVVLDEATAHADAESEALVQKAFARMAVGKTVLVIAHRLKTVERADQILVLDGGRLSAAGSHEGLLETCPTYRLMADADRSRDTWSMRQGSGSEGKEARHV